MSYMNTTYQLCLLRCFEMHNDTMPSASMCTSGQLMVLHASCTLLAYFLQAPASCRRRPAHLQNTCWFPLGRTAIWIFLIGTIGRNSCMAHHRPPPMPRVLLYDALFESISHLSGMTRAESLLFSWRWRPARLHHLSNILCADLGTGLT